MKLSIKSFGQTDIGQRRKNNQDNFICDDALGLYAVADGMGGHHGGELASAVAIETLKAETEIIKKANPKEILAAVKICIENCNRAVFESGRANGFPGMGTTLTSAFFWDNDLYIGHVGDSRLLLYRDNNVFQITEDHSQVYELLRAGLINEGNAHLVQKNIITRSVGFDSTVVVDTMVRPVLAGDRYIICSDGLTGMMNHQEIAQVIQNSDFKHLTTKLIDLANLRGGEDNITVVVLEVMA